MHLHSLFSYPIKGAKAVNLQQSKVWTTGLTDDRQLMIVHADSYGFVSQRSHPDLARLQVQLWDSQLQLSFDGDTQNFLLSATMEKSQVKIWGDQAHAFDLGDQLADFLSKHLRSRVRLVKFNHKKPRLADQKYTDASLVPYGFADGFPYLITSTASLADLNSRLLAKSRVEVPMSRFRPNLVIACNDPFIEDRVDVLSIGSARFKLCKPCSRCQVTTTDQLSGQVDSDKEPLATLGEYRRLPDKQGIAFGQNAYLISGESSLIKVGDPVSWTLKS